MVTAGPTSQPIVNALTIDVEDYFHATVFDGVVPRETWDTMESRVCRNTERLLRLLDTANVRATFFVLGWVARRHPGLIRSIAAAGHEIGSHSDEHRLVFNMTPEEFRRDLQRAREAIESAAGVRTVAYRAPSYSITERSLWALDVLAEEGYRYDASIFPVWHDRYGIPTAPRHPYLLHRSAGTLVEAPPSTVRVFGVNLPVAGGGYARHLPYLWTRLGISDIHRRESRPAIFYLHPWEIDPEQPRLRVPLASHLRHYHNLHRTEARLRRLLGSLTFAPLGHVLRPLLRLPQLVTTIAPRPSSAPPWGHPVMH